MSPDNVIVAESLVKIYKTKDIEVLALQGLDLTIARGEVMAIIGNSGSGKSTLLNMIGGLDKPSAGSLIVDGKDLFKMKEKDLVAYKTVTVGFVWQNNARNLIPYLTAMENTMMPMQFNTARPVKNKKARARDLLELVGMGHRATHQLGQLSGGEQQRVAIALALANHPAVLLADEPTGSVDTKTTNAILDMFRAVNRELGTTVVIVTHDREISKRVERVVAIRDGKTSSEFIMSYAHQLANIEGFGGKGAQVELAVLDRAGRVQIPREFLDKMGLEGNRLRIHMDDENRVILQSP
ncbi:MAG: ABC transporter ATP-binding protein [Defluviitaleaceae bacterium]|nr:ABC transporter ATP-binding protein [Defluviitaleaceae bacterium]MCL2238992.1 ABC transporter ATP-binding protein [Defluviitaleaceae bacterium]